MTHGKQYKLIQCVHKYYYQQKHHLIKIGINTTHVKNNNTRPLFKK